MVILTGTLFCLPNCHWMICMVSFWTGDDISCTLTAASCFTWHILSNDQSIEADIPQWNSWDQSYCSILQSFIDLSSSPDSLSEGASWVEEANGPTTCLVVAAGWSASQGDGDGPGICLGDGQTEAPGVLAESGHSGALLWRILPYLTWPNRCQGHGWTISEDGSLVIQWMTGSPSPEVVLRSNFGSGGVPTDLW